MKFGANRLSGLFSRFDDLTLRAPTPGTGLGSADRVMFNKLRDWCVAGSGPGCSPALRPWLPPKITQRLAVAALTGDDTLAIDMANHLALELDGSWRLSDMGSASRISLKLLTKLRDAMWWRALSSNDPWDCGFLRRDGVAAMSRFKPRRRTLIVVQSVPGDELLQLGRTLLERERLQAHAVRLLVLGAVPAELHAISFVLSI